MSAPPTVLVAAAGTGGHVVPGLAVAEALCAAGVARDHVHFVGTRRGVENRLVPAADFPLSHIDARPLLRSASPRNVAVAVATVRAARQTRALARRIGATHFLGFGGYVTLPAALGVRRRLPIVLHEQNTRPGLANRLAARLADVVAVTFAEACVRFPVRCVETGNPVRSALAHLDRAARRPVALARFGLQPDRTTLLVTGGSQGAARLNAALPAALRVLAGHRLQVLILAGPAHAEAVRHSLSGIGIPLRVEAFVTEMEDAYAAADVALTRGGAASCAELACAGLPAILVPYPHAAADEQTRNALVLVEAGAARLVRDADLDGVRLATELAALLDEPETLASMAAAMRARARPDAAAAVAALVLA